MAACCAGSADRGSGWSCWCCCDGGRVGWHDGSGGYVQNTFDKGVGVHQLARGGAVPRVGLQKVPDLLNTRSFGSQEWLEVSDPRLQQHWVVRSKVSGFETGAVRQHTG